MYRLQKRKKYLAHRHCEGEARSNWGNPTGTVRILNDWLIMILTTHLNHLLIC